MILDHTTHESTARVDRHQQTVSPGAASCSPERPQAEV